MKNVYFLILAVSFFFALACRTPKPPIIQKSFAEKIPVKEKEYVPLTRNIIKEYNIITDTLKKLQYYSEEDSLILAEGVQNKKGFVESGGKLVLKSTDTENRILINPRTPGVFVGIESSGVIKVTFTTDDSEFILFAPASDADGTYQIYAPDLDENSNPKIKYGKKTMKIVSGAQSRLFVDLKQIPGIGTKKIEPGRRVGGYTTQPRF